MSNRNFIHTIKRLTVNMTTTKTVAWRKSEQLVWLRIWKPGNSKKLQNLLSAGQCLKKTNLSLLSMTLDHCMFVPSSLDEHDY